MGCACPNGWVSTSGQGEGGGGAEPVGPHSRASPSIGMVRRWEQRRMRGQCWEEGRVLWPHTHLSVLLLQWRRAAFPRQVSGTVGLGTVLGQGTSAGGPYCSLACINNQKMVFAGGKSYFQVVLVLG